MWPVMSGWEAGLDPFRELNRLPFEVDNDQIAARYEQGVLKVSLPRHEATKPRRIAVQS